MEPKRMDNQSRHWFRKKKIQFDDCDELIAVAESINSCWASNEVAEPLMLPNPTHDSIGAVSVAVAQ